MCSRATFDRVSNISELIIGQGSAVELNFEDVYFYRCTVFILIIIDGDEVMEEQVAGLVVDNTLANNRT